MAIKLICADERLRGHCAELVRRLDSVNELNGFSGTVVVKPNFDDLSDQGAIQQSPTVLRPSTSELDVNEGVFFGLEDDTQLSVIAHELGHEAHNRGARLPYLPNDISSCIVADVWTCIWGFGNGLLKERRLSRGQEYCAILSQAKDNELGERLQAWHYQRLAGIV